MCCVVVVVTPTAASDVLCAHRKQSQLDSGLEQLRRFFAWIFLITGTLNLVVMIVMRSMLSDYIGLLEDAQMFGQRQLLVQVSVLHLLEYAFSL